VDLLLLDTGNYLVLLSSNAGRGNEENKHPNPLMKKLFGIIIAVWIFAVSASPASAVCYQDAFRNSSGSQPGILRPCFSDEITSPEGKGALR
jgi:hypothetical protein